MITRYKLFESRKPLRIDDYGKLIVWENGDYSISVNSVDDATYIALWYEGKKAGEMFLTKGRNMATKDYMTVQNVSIQPKHQGRGLGLEMYKAALKYSSVKYKGIGGENEQRSNNKQVPAIYRKLGGRQLEDGSFVIDRDTYIVGNG